MIESIYITNYWPLFALFAITFVIYYSKHSLDSFSNKRRVKILTIRISLFILLVIALLDVRLKISTDRQAVVWLIDVSDSMGNEAINRYFELKDKINTKSLFENETVIAFATEASVVTKVERLDDFKKLSIDKKNTDLAGALRLARASFPSGFNNTIILFSDGRAPLSWVEEAEALKASNIQTHVVSIHPPNNPEVILKNISAPKQVNISEPFNIDIEIISNSSSDAVIKIFKNGLLTSTNSVLLKAGQNRYNFEETISENKLSEFTIEIHSKNDSIVDNNTLSTLVQSKGVSKALIITDNLGAVRYLSWALKDDGILLDTRPLAGAPTSMSDLQNYDLLVIDNIAATQLRADQFILYKDYVKDFGGGFLMLGGDQSFGLGGYYRTVIEEMLPVKCDFEKEKEDPALGLALLIDKSGSMNGEKIEMAKDAAKAAIELLSQNDYAGVVAFDGDAFWVANMQTVFDKFGLINLISSIQAGGGTNISPAMELAYNQLNNIPAKIKHVIILTDGQSQPGPFYELTTRMTQEKITVSTVGVGQNADTNLLSEIAQWGNGRFYFTDDASSIPQIFAKETMTASKSVLREIPFLPQVITQAEFLEGIDFSSAPFLYGYVATQPKPTAEIWLSTENGEPLLATWRYGLGNVGAFTSDARNRWAVEWLRWNGYSKFWVQVFRKLMRVEALKNFPMLIDKTSDGYKIQIESIDNFGNIVNHTKGKARILFPDGSRNEYELNHSIPSLLEALVKTNLQGIYHIDLELFDSKNNSLFRKYIPEIIGYSAEYLMLPPDIERLEKLATDTNGRIYSNDEKLITENNNDAVREIEIWSWILIFTLLLFLFDVACKRLPEN